ncbi:type IV secretion system protein (plasmid) [Cupriavidus basilensis]
MTTLSVFLLRLLAALALALACTVPAYAQASTQGAGEIGPYIGSLNSGTAKTPAENKCSKAEGYFRGMDQIGAKLKGLQNFKSSLLEKAKQTAEKLMNPARAVGGTLALIALLWGLTIALGTEQGTPLTVVIDVVLPAAVVALLLAYYGQFVDGMVSASEMIASATSSPWDAMLKLVATMLSTLMNGLTGVIAAFACTEFGLSMLGVVLGSAVALFLLLAATYVMIRAIVDIIAVIFLGPFLAAVGAAVGPIFIAFGASKWTRSWISSWVGFLIQALLLSFFAALVLELMEAPFEAISQEMHFAASAGEGGLTVALDALAILALSLLASRLFGQIPQIVSTLFPGNLGVVTGDGRKSTAKAAKEAGGVLKDAMMKIPGVKTAADGATRLTNQLLGRGGSGSGSSGSASRGGQGPARPFRTVSSTNGQRAAARMAARRGKSSP